MIDLNDLVEEIKKASKDVEIAAILAIAWDRGASAEQHRICEVIRRQASNPNSLLHKIKAAR